MTEAEKERAAVVSLWLAQQQRAIRMIGEWYRRIDERREHVERGDHLKEQANGQG